MRNRKNYGNISREWLFGAPNPSNPPKCPSLPLKLVSFEF